MTPRKATVKILYNNKDISESLAPYLKSLSYTDSMSGQADDLQITVEDRSGRWEGAWFPDKGAKLTVSLVTSSWSSLSATETTTPLGVFEIDEISSKGYPSEVSIKAVSVPDNVKLRDETQTRSWEEVSFRRIAKDIAEEAGLTLVYDLDENPMIDRAEQTEESSLAFLHNMCRQRGYALKVYKEQLVIFDEADYEDGDAVAVIVKPKTVYTAAKGTTYITNLLSYSLSTKMREVYASAHVSYYDSDIRETIEATYSDSSKTTGKTLQINEQVGSIAEAKELAKKRLREKNAQEVTGEISLIGTPSLMAGVCVTLKGFGSFDAKYIIERARHTLGSGYTTSLSIRRCLDGY